MFYLLNKFCSWLPLLLEILGNMCIIIICFLVCDVIKFEINLNFLIKPFSNLIKNEHEIKFLKDENSF